MIQAFKYLYEANKAYRKRKFEKLADLPEEIIHKKSSEKGWCIEELVRHMIRTEEWWMNRIILHNEKPFYPIGIDNDTVSTKWYELDEIWKAWAEVEEVLHEYLNSDPQLDLPVPRTNPEWNEKFSGRWVLYHLLQHELETWGMIAERLRKWGESYWEF